MNLYDSILASRPLTSFKINAGGTAYTDITNRGVAFTPDTTLAFGNSIIASEDSKSIYAKNANRASFNSNIVYVKGYERQSWSIEAWVSPINPTSGGLLAVISHLNLYDGISVDNDYIHFKIDYATQPDIDLKWAMPDRYEAWHVVGTYTTSKVTLYINGEMVAEQEITDAQALDTFSASATSTVYTGQSSGTLQGMVDGIAIYTRALTDAEIYKHFLAGRSVFASRDVAGIYGGNNFNGVNRDVFYTKEWTGTDFYNGSFTNVEFRSGSLTPANDASTLLSLAGVWTGVYEVAAAETNLYGVQVDWDGVGNFLVETSINDGASWQTATNGRVLAGTWNWSVTLKTVLIRITFTGGVTSDTSAVSRLRVISFTTPYIYGTDRSRRIETFNSGVSTNPDNNEPIETNFKAGFETFTSGLFKINPDTEVDDNRPIRSLDFWWKPNAAVVSTSVFDSRPGGGTEYLILNASSQLAFISGTLYVNGVSTATASFVPQVDQWYHIVYVFSANVAVAIDFPASGLKQINQINVYPTALTATDAANIYKFYIGYPRAALATEASPVVEASPAFKLYAYDWSISPSGG